MAEAGPAPAGGGFWTGLALMLLNAKAGFFWVSFTGVLLGPDIAPLARAPAPCWWPCCCRCSGMATLALAFSGRG